MFDSPGFFLLFSLKNQLVWKEWHYSNYLIASVQPRYYQDSKLSLHHKALAEPFPINLTATAQTQSRSCCSLHFPVIALTSGWTSEKPQTLPKWKISQDNSTVGKSSIWVMAVRLLVHGSATVRTRVGRKSKAPRAPPESTLTCFE